MFGVSVVKGNVRGFLFLVMLLTSTPIVHAQDTARQLSPNDSRLDFEFAIQAGTPPFHFHVRLNKSGTITGVDIFRQDEDTPFQSLPSCMPTPDTVNGNWLDAELSQLISHDDLNFDGYQDLELLQYYIPHLDKHVYCIFMWEPKDGQFVLSKALSDIAANLEVHAEDHTIDTHEDWQGGSWQESSYRWNDGKLELIEQNSLLGDWGLQTKEQCGFTFTCSSLVNGKMTTTLEKPICDPGKMDNLPPCPDGPLSHKAIDTAKPGPPRTR